MSSRPIHIAVTAGDPCGIGPEVTRKALNRLKADPKIRFTVIGPAAAFQGLRRDRALTVLDPCPGRSEKFRPGKPGAAGARASLDYLRLAVSLLKQKNVDGLVTAPVSKEGICRLGVPFAGHTEYLAAAFGVRQFDMMFVSPTLKTVTVTRHIPVAKVPAALTRQRVLSTLRMTHQSLKDLFGIRRPVIAVCGLNPHAGEGGTIGREEIRAVIPAVKLARKEKINAVGPLSADTLFIAQNARPYDAVVAMYHDQGLIAVKTLYFRRVVNLTVGLPFIRTSPAHGTAFDIAGKNTADFQPMAAAIRLAADLTRRRRSR